MKWRRLRRQQQQQLGVEGDASEWQSLITLRSMEAPLIKATKADTSLTPGRKQIHTPSAQ